MQTNFVRLVLLTVTLALGGCERSQPEEETPPNEQRVEGEQAGPQQGETIGEESTSNPSRRAEEQRAAEVPQNLSEDELVAALHRVHAAELGEAELARDRASSSEVQRFAERMITDHTQLRDQLNQAVTELGLQRQEGQATERLQREATERMNQLREASEPEFDRVYIGTQVRAHQNAIDILDANVPTIDDPQLRDVVEDQRRVLQEHLRLAEQIQSSLEAQASR